MGLNRRHLLYLSREDVERVDLPMTGVIEILHQMFRTKGDGRVEMPPKPGIHPRPDAFIHAMPAYISEPESAGLKWVSGYPENQKRGLPYIGGLLILNDPETGLPIALMDCTWITAMRTGAATALAAKYLAHEEASTVGIVACGVQGRSNLEALASLLKITRVRAYDIHPEMARRFADEMERKLELEVEPVKTLREAVCRLDIVVSSGPIRRGSSPLIEPDWLARGAFAVPLDFDSYWQGKALQQADKLATDDLEQLRHYRREGFFRETPEPYADLGEIISGKRPGRESGEERIICINLGLAAEDVATAIRVYQEARARGIGLELPL